VNLQFFNQVPDILGGEIFDGCSRFGHNFSTRSRKLFL